MSEQEERTAFEAGIKSINFPLTRKGEGYRSTYTDNMWMAYQAGRVDERTAAHAEIADLRAKREKALF
jgi:hypothetical protein